MKPAIFTAFIALCCSGFAQTAAKNKQSERFFWYTGTKAPTTANANEITLTAPNGDVVKFIKRGSYFTFVLKKENEIVKNIRKKLPASKKQKESLVKAAIDKKGPAYYTITKQMVDEHESVDKAYEKVTTNTISLADPFQQVKENTSGSNESNGSAEIPATPEWIKTKQQEIVSYAQSIKGKRSFDLPKPAAYDFACNLCQKDSTIRKKTETSRQEYSNKIFQKEKDAVMVEGIKLDIDPSAYKCFKIIAKNVTKLPAWHPGKGDKGWLFIDEIFFN